MICPRKILLVDDEAHIRKYVGLIIKKFSGARIFEAADGLTALAIYAQEKPDLVLLDVSMPVLDGLQTLERLRLLAPESKVVMLTSLTNRQTVEMCARLGALDYLRKDIAKHELAAQLQEIVEACFDPESRAPAGELP